MTRALRNAALDYADRGWHVMPLRPRHKAPLGALVPHGKDDATDDLAQVLRWWTKAPQANVGIVAGPSGLVILDVDPRNGGDDSLHELERELGGLPDTVRAQTGGGGEHHLFRHPGGTVVGVLADGLDVKDHGYIVAAPSTHPSGGVYEWDIEPGEMEPADLPTAWVDRLRAPVARRTTAADLTLKVDHEDPLRRIPAAVYAPRLSRRETDLRGWMQCPFHGGGQERTPSLSTDATVWACYACQPIGGRHVMGGNIYDFAGLLAGYALPLRGPDFLDIQSRLTRFFGVAQ